MYIHLYKCTRHKIFSQAELSRSVLSWFSNSLGGRKRNWTVFSLALFFFFFWEANKGKRKMASNFSEKETTSTVKAPMEVSRVTSGAPPSALAHIFPFRAEWRRRRLTFCLARKKRKEKKMSVFSFVSKKWAFKSGQTQMGHKPTHSSHRQLVLRQNGKTSLIRGSDPLKYSTGFLSCSFVIWRSWDRSSFPKPWSESPPRRRHSGA